MPACIARRMRMMPVNKSIIMTVTVLLSLTNIAAATEAPETGAISTRDQDPHYTPAGFFDLHVCNWPDRNLFFMPLFSTVRYNEITSIDVHYPDGKTLTSLNLDKYMAVKRENKPEKRVFMSEIDVPDSAEDGWYTVTVKLSDGTEITAKDYVIISSLPRISEVNPPDGAENIPLPLTLSWTPAADSKYYQVYIRDVWQDSKLIYTSKLLDKPELAVPAGVLEPDGLYSWKVHARDVNEDVVLGDFNKGSISRAVTFSTAAD